MASKTTSRYGAAASTGRRKPSPRGASRSHPTRASTRSRATTPRTSRRASGAARAATPRRRSWLLPLSLSVLVVVAAWSFYPVARVQYGEQRQKARLEAELESLKERNSALRAEVDRLKTPEGVEEVARESLGLVKQGENVYVVLDGDESEATPTLAPDSAAAALPGESGWLKVLDAIFGFE